MPPQEIQLQFLIGSPYPAAPAHPHAGYAGVIAVRPAAALLERLHRIIISLAPLVNTHSGYMILPHCFTFSMCLSILNCLLTKARFLKYAVHAKNAFALVFGFVTLILTHRLPFRFSILLIQTVYRFSDKLPCPFPFPKRCAPQGWLCRLSSPLPPSLWAFFFPHMQQWYYNYTTRCLHIKLLI